MNEQTARSGQARSGTGDFREDARNQENGTRDNPSEQAGETAPLHRSNETQAGSLRSTVQRIRVDKQSQPQSIESRVGNAEQQSKKNVTHQRTKQVPALVRRPVRRQAPCQTRKRQRTQKPPEDAGSEAPCHRRAVATHVSLEEHPECSPDQ